MKLSSFVLFGAVATVLHAAPPVDLDVALRQWLGENPHGVAAAWVDESGVTFANAGQFAAADARAITPDTYFEIGSLTKVFTGALLADAVQQGKLQLDDAVGAPFAPSAITYRQLVTHTSGLPRMAAKPPGAPRGPVDFEILQSAYASAAPAAKLSASSYSNLGFAVLGHAVAHTWGESYADAMRRRVLLPLGLSGTKLAWTEIDPAQLAPGHNAAGRAANLDFKAEAPAGSLMSTTRELARFVQANLGLLETPLNPVLAVTREPLADGDQPTRKIGHAWVVESRGPDTVVWHNGGTDGYRSFLVLNGAKKTGLVLLANHSARGLEALGFSVLAGRMPPAAPKLPPEVKLAAEVLADYPGSYALGPVSFTVTLEADALFVQLTGQPKFPVFASAKDEFFLRAVPASISFERDAAGKVVALVLHQNGRDQRATRQ